MDNKRKFVEEILVAQEFFNKIGFELIDTKDINNEEIYLLKKPKIAADFLKKKGFFNKIGFDLVGINEIANEEIYFVKKKRS